jgi:Domain of unknown function (DUF4218)
MTMCTCTGAYILLACRDMPKNVLYTLVMVMQCCGVLWEKSCSRQELQDLREYVVLTLSLVEAHLPASELDIKMHNMLHMVDMLSKHGPLYNCSMFPYESLWGKITRWARNKRDPEVTMARQVFICPV